MAENTKQSPAKPPTRPADQSPKELATTVASNAIELAHLQLQLAKAEVSERLIQGLVGVAWIVVGAALLSAAIISLVRAVVDALAPTLAPWVASLLVGVCCLVIAGIAFWVGVRYFGKTSTVTVEEKREMERDRQLVEEKMP